MARGRNDRLDWIADNSGRLLLALTAWLALQTYNQITRSVEEIQTKLQSFQITTADRLGRIEERLSARKENP